MVGPFCSADPTLRDLLYDCPVLNAELGTAPDDWSLHLDDPTQQCYWLRGIARGAGQCIAWKSRLLPGKTQSAPRAGLYAIVELSRHTSGAVSFSNDSQLNMTTFRRLVHGHQLKSNCANLDLWLELQPVLFSRWLHGTWVRSHLTQAQFEEQFGSENLWAFASNASADEAAGKFSTWLDGQQILSTWVGIRRWTDSRNFQVVQYLTARVMRVLKAPKEGPQRVSRLEFLEGLPLTHSHHCWRLGVSRSFSSCLLCGWRVSHVAAGRRLAGFAALNVFGLLGIG